MPRRRHRKPDLIAPKLTMVRGWVTLEAGAALTAPVLGLVDGWVTLKAGAVLKAIHLAEVRNDLTLAGDDGTLETQTQSTVSTTDTQTKGV